MNAIVMAAPGADACAHRLATELQAPLASIEARRFPDGETYLRVQDDVAGREVVVAAQLRDPDPQALGLWYLAHTARELGARRVGLVAPYLPYMRQDQRFHAGEAVTSKLFARFISEAFDWLVTVDPHLHRLAGLSAVYRIPAETVASAPAIAHWIAREVAKPVIVGPDSESEQWAGDVAQRVGCPTIVLQKTRLGDRNVRITVADASAHAGRTPVLIDDIISSARTMAVATARVREAFGCPPVCVGVHAVFAPEALQALVQAGADRIVTCNTLPHETNAIDVTSGMAQAVRRLAAV